MDYVFTLSNEAEIYEVQGVDNLKRPVKHRIKFHAKTLSAADNTAVARVATIGAGGKEDKRKSDEQLDSEWQERYLAKFHEETFVRQIVKIENIHVRDTKDGDAREMTDPQEVWNSDNLFVSAIASEVHIWLNSRTEVPVKNSK